MVLEHLGAGFGSQHGVDVGDHLVAGVPAGTKGQLVEDSAVGPGVGQRGDGGHADLVRLGVVVDEGEDGLVSLLPDAARAAAVLTQLTSMIGDGDGGEMLVVGWTGGARSR